MCGQAHGKREAAETRRRKEVKRLTSKIRDQILAIRDTGLTNMFDKNMVQRLAFERDMHELVLFLEDEPKEDVKFIMHGDNLPA